MIPIDWGNMILAFAALAGFFGWIVYFGLSMIFMDHGEFKVIER